MKSFVSIKVVGIVEGGTGLTMAQMIDKVLESGDVVEVNVEPNFRFEFSEAGDVPAAQPEVASNTGNGGSGVMLPPEAPIVEKNPESPKNAAEPCTPSADAAPVSAGGSPAHVTLADVRAFASGAMKDGSLSRDQVAAVLKEFQCQNMSQLSDKPSEVLGAVLDRLTTTAVPF